MTETLLRDPYFRVDVVAATPNPQQLIYAALHQDYSENYVFASREAWPDETTCGQIAVKRLLAGDRGHMGPLEHPQITFNVGWFPHSVMQQARTHRISSFDVQSGRYTGKRIIDACEGIRDLEEVFYLRPAGHYTDRQGHRYEYTADQRELDLRFCARAATNYAYLIDHGFAEEHARDLIPYAIRQHFVASFNLRSLLHLLDVRAKLDAQLEIRQLCDLLWPHLQAWAPEVAAWYHSTRLGKARLAP